MEIIETPFPILKDGYILVRTHYSVISAGTEGKTVTDARLGYIAKAKARKKEVKQVIESVKSNGLMETYNIVMNKLTAPTPLGYSCSGEVISVGSQVKNIKIGDFVACGGSSANHSEINSVPKNLCAKIPEKVNLKYAAFSTLGSIAIQGIRQAELSLGEKCVVIGLGLIGQLTLQILNAGGNKAYGIDLSSEKVKLANECLADSSFQRNTPSLIETIYRLTDGIGADAVIITAATNSMDPFILAGDLCRVRGKVVIVGGVPTDVNANRDVYYKKELDVRMSMSYGPGRYDPVYEEKGIDYPVGYVRWTENRNMQTFLDLLADDKLQIDKLITHFYKFENAQEPYQMIVDKSDEYVGILLEYDVNTKLNNKIFFKNIKYNPDDVKIGLIGAGSFAQNVLLPKMKGKCKMVGISTGKGNIAKYVGENYGFNYGTDNPDELFSDQNINTIFILTRHDSHAKYVLKGIENNKNIYVEKPLTLYPTELEKIKSIYLEQAEPPQLMVGFNRRFSPFIRQLKDNILSKQPLAIHYRINAGMVPKTDWAHDFEVGGGRIIGEICHFIDTVMVLAGSSVSTVSADAISDPDNLLDTVIVNLTFKNGSIASISYFSNGNKAIPKEKIEVFDNGTITVIDDFKNMNVYGKKSLKVKLKKQDKGHGKEIEEFLSSIADGGYPPISFKELYHVSLVTFKVIESIQQSAKINI